MSKVQSNLTEQEQADHAIYQKGYEDGRDCMRLHLKRMQKKLDKLEKATNENNAGLQSGKNT